MDIREVFRSQYLAALAMLGEAVLKCPPQAWDAPRDKFKFWSKAYHTLYFAHLYLQECEADFIPWEKHHDPDGGTPFTKEEVLEYLSFVEKQVVDRVASTNLESAESGFHWYPVNRLEMHFINIRHIQQHTGELYECLGIRENAELGWTGHIHKEHE